MSQATNWNNQIESENQAFLDRIDPNTIPTARAPGQCVITCMDPRVNLEAIGIPGFSEKGSNSSSMRIIRTLGAMAENRSLIVGIFLAGFREITLVMHTDCGCCLAHSKIDVILENMQNRLSVEAFDSFKADIGEPLEENLQAYLKTFDKPRQAVKREIESIQQLPFIPDDLVLHGVLYELKSGKAEVIVNGYASS